MPDATPEWLVEFVDQDGAHEFDHCDTLDDVQVRVRKLFDAGIREVYVYQLVPFTVKVDVTVKAPRRRKRKGSTNAGAAGPDAQNTTKDAAVQEAAVSPVIVAAGEKPVSPSLWICEASFPSDPACPGAAEFDPATKGRFCGFHLAEVPETHRREMHRLHGHRNAPAMVAKVA